jgi:hypothetical protein
MEANPSDYFESLSGMLVSCAWRGYGSAIFFEFGTLRPALNRAGLPGVRKDGTPLHPTGEMGAMIGGGWRIEIAGSVVADDQSNAHQIELALNRMEGLRVSSMRTIGRPPEIEVEMSNGWRVTTYADEILASDWTLFDSRGAQKRWLHVQDGQLTEEAQED